MTRVFAKVRGAAIALVSTAAALTPASAAAGAAHLDGASLGPLWAVPFVGLLLSIAIMPLATPHFWHKNYGKVSLAWAVAFLVPFTALYGFDLALYEFLHVMLLDYVPFIILLFALYTISGGVFLEGHIKGTPWTNTGLLAGGTAIASITGTTGASVLLIRPMLRANEGRSYNVHVFVFFIFLVSNIGGSLTPLGDPPLYLGFLKGVDFFWPTVHLLNKTLLAAAILLAVFFLLDSAIYARDTRKQTAKPPRDETPIKLRGWLNIFLLGIVIAVILLSAVWKTDAAIDVAGVHVDFPNILRAIALLGLAALSLWLTPKAFRQGNDFTWGPIAEVAKLFAGIFVTIVPVLAMLKAGTDGAFAPLLTLLTGPDGQPNNAAYFWLTGGLSSFLDNAPTYLVFFNAAGGDPQVLMTTLASTLAAVSAGSVFMGANTYIGNAPNFMVKAIAEDRGIRMPSFFGYMAWSCGILIPLFVVMTFVWFR